MRCMYALSLAFVLFSAPAALPQPVPAQIEARQVNTCDTQRKAKIRARLDEKFSSLRLYTRWWSFSYHATLVIATLASASAALFLKIKGGVKPSVRENWAAILSALSALLLTLLTGGGMGQKWQSTRIAAFAIDNLRYELDKTNPDCDKILDDLQQIIMQREQAVTGAGHRTPGTPGAQ